MDRERFDELARLLATKGSRRSAVGALFSVAILGHDPDEAEAKNGKSGKKGRKDSGKDNKNQNRNQNSKRKRNQNSGPNNDASDDAERQVAADIQAEDVAAVPEGADAPDVQAEAAGGGGKRKGKARGKGKSKGRNKKQSPSRTSQTLAEATRCCGTKSCSLPTAGSNRYECNFAGQNLSGRTMTGVNFGRIDGRKTNFNNANVRGANFGEACLQGATFRGADVSSTNFGRACLFFADFTGAKNLNVSVNFSTALLCGTILADGTVSNRDCGRATACCAACDAQRPCTTPGQICCNGRCVTGVCCAAGDCRDQVCQTKSCVGNECRYSPVTGGTCPAPGGGTGTCCNGVCCQPNETCVGGQCRACNAQTCATGCCDAQGICRQSSNTTCGVGGEPCTNCPPGNNCVNGDCVCNAASCPNGCCSNGPGNAGTCQASSDTTCGVNGVRCVDCPDGNVCVGGVCVCNAASCPTGCCSNGPGNPGVCRASGNDTCGINGVQCVDCPDGNVCNAQGVCVCNANSCPAGCCSNGPGNAGLCRANGDDTCGINGVRCVDCPSGTVCNAQGQCVCNQTSCPNGCCDTATGPCITPPTDQNCGTNGAICLTCPDGTDCVNGSCGCNADSCPGGCCDTAAGPCVSPPTTENCGSNGVICITCPSGTVCNAQGQCICTAASCQTGCCSNGPGNVGVCQPSGPDTCGINGVLCVDCPTGTVCNAQGQCVCTVASCSTGCCSNGPGNVGVCRTNSDTTCGVNGVLCVDCPDGTVCNAQGQCVCNATSCPTGCCDSPTGPCISPPETNNCGTNGNICITCPSGTVCNGQGQCVCTAASCQAGCCSNGPGNVGTCRPSGPDTCGINGVQCVDCPNGNACNAQGVCVCTAASCSTGCCSAGPGNPGTCQVSSDTTCGTGGEQCTDCPDGNQCVAGDCVCTAASCSTGCCSAGSGNPGICRVSGDDTCGTGGELCVDCPTGNVCEAGDCVCNATSCPNGCCSNGPGNAGTCQASTNDTCGRGGVQCVDCPIGTPFCNASGICVACLTPANCPTPPTCSVATCSAVGVCGTTPLNNQSGPGCLAADGKTCCSGKCVTAQAGQCPVCCQDAPDCPEPFKNCRGMGACGNLGLEVCTETEKCCVL